MHQDFDREVLARLPLAEATLLLWQFVCDDTSRHELYDQHRGRTYQKKLCFPLMAQLIRDALLEPDGSGHKSFCQAQQDGILPTVLSSTYDKLAHLPPALSEAFLAAGADRLRQVFANTQVAPLDDAIAPSLADFEILVVDGKVVKRVPRRLRPARPCKGGLLGGKGLVALHLRSGLALAVATDSVYRLLKAHQQSGRPVSPVRAEGFTIYVANLRSYHKTLEIAANPRVELCYLDAHHDQVRISGVAEVVTDRALLQQIWDSNPLLRQYLGSLDNPELVLYRIRPTRVRFMQEWALQYHEVPLVE